MQIIAMQDFGIAMRKQAAEVLHRAFLSLAPTAWPDLSAASDEVEECLRSDWLAFAAVEEETVVGWIGGRPEYDGHVWELHPLAVDPKHQGKGVGRELVGTLAMAAAEKGGLTLFLGTDDEMGMTSAAGQDLYGRIDHFVAHLENYHGHPFSFYQKVGFEIVGFVPDANGRGKPDILMAKSIR